MDLSMRNLVFKHEFMHAWHWSLGITDKAFDKYSERATSAFSVAYANATGNSFYSYIWRSDLGWYPRQYDWRNFNNIFPTGIK